MEKKIVLEYTMHKDSTDEATSVELAIVDRDKKYEGDIVFVYKDGTIQYGMSDGIYPSFGGIFTSERREVKIDEHGIYAEKCLSKRDYFWALGAMAYHDLKVKKIKEAVKKKMGETVDGR